MRRQTRSKMPLIRLMFAMLLASMLFGVGFYAYYKRNAAQGLTLVDSFDQIKSRLVQYKKKWHAELQASKKAVLEDELPQEQVKFEFYDTLAEAQVKVADADQSSAETKSIQPVEPVRKPLNMAAKRQKDLQKEIKQAGLSSTSIMSPDELEKAFYADMTAKRK